MECLVTKLKASVNDNSLLPLGGFRLSLKEGTISAGLLSVTSSTPCIISLLSGNLVIKAYGSDVAESLPYIVPSTGASWKTLEVGTGGAVIEVRGKYSIKEFAALNKQMSENVDINNINYLTSALYLNSDLTKNDYQIVGDLSDIKGYDSLTGLNWTSPLSTGEIKECGKFLLLNKIGIYGSSVRGDLVELVQEFRSRGRTSGEVSLGWLPASITFNGESAAVNTTTVLTWTADTISWNGTTINL